MKVKRSYLISYFYEGGKGRAFVDSENDRLPTRQDIEDWERKLKESNGFKTVGTIAFCEITGPSLTEDDQK